MIIFVILLKNFFFFLLYMLVCVGRVIKKRKRGNMMWNNLGERGEKISKLNT